MPFIPVCSSRAASAAVGEESRKVAGFLYDGQFSYLLFACNFEEFNNMKTRMQQNKFGDNKGHSGVTGQVGKSTHVVLQPTSSKVKRRQVICNV